MKGSPSGTIMSFKSTKMLGCFLNSNCQPFWFKILNLQKRELLPSLAMPELTNLLLFMALIHGKIQQREKGYVHDLRTKHLMKDDRSSTNDVRAFSSISGVRYVYRVW